MSLMVIKSEKAHTLIEILLVCAIVALLSSLSIVGYSVHQRQTAIRITKANLASLRTAIELFQQEEMGDTIFADLSNLTNGACLSGTIYLPGIPQDAISETNRVMNLRDNGGGWYWDPWTSQLQLNLSGPDINGDYYESY